MGVLQPMHLPTGAFPVAGPPGYNRLSYAPVRMSYAMLRKSVKAFRDEVLGLGPVRNGAEVLMPWAVRDMPVLHAFSELVVPRPQDWPNHAVVTGGWRLPEAWGHAPSPRLEAFSRPGCRRSSWVSAAGGLGLRSRKGTI